MSFRGNGASPTNLAELVRLGHALQQVNKRTESRLGLSLVQFHVLRELLDLPGSSSQILAAKAGLHPSTLTQSIRRLARKGYLFVAADPKDSRKKQLTVTRAGKNAVERFGARAGEIFADVRASHSLLADWVLAADGGRGASQRGKASRGFGPRQE
ncbi:MAG: MarR family transcriptional regulator [Planctomycetes bacterium]|nr:MarR family transcriptional regulator [Planctomycetota bacterium]